jgi:hypothetical protein
LLFLDNRADTTAVNRNQRISDGSISDDRSEISSEREEMESTFSSNSFNSPRIKSIEKTGRRSPQSYPRGTDLISNQFF